MSSEMYVTHVALKFLKRIYYKLNIGRYQIYFDLCILQNDPSPKVALQTLSATGLGLDRTWAVFCDPKKFLQNDFH